MTARDTVLDLLSDQQTDDAAWAHAADQFRAEEWNEAVNSVAAEYGLVNDAGIAVPGWVEMAQTKTL